jgi:drug/metabolite transporter (DMT)-like permease
MIWGIAFVVQRFAALEMGVFLFTGARFLVGALVLLPLVWLQARRNPEKPAPLRRSELSGVALVGLLMFAGANLQQAGMQYTTAGNAGFITGLYVVFIPLFLAIIWRQPPRPVVWLAACLAIAGLFLLSTGGELQINPGDLMELVGAVFWSFHVIALGRLVRRMDLLKLSVGQYLVCGGLSLAFGLVSEADQIPAVLQGWWAVIYAGAISVGLGYTLQALGQRHAPPADAAIILSTEAVFAAVSGWWFLGELLRPVQVLGCAVILIGMLLAQLNLSDRRVVVNEKKEEAVG